MTTELLKYKFLGKYKIIEEIGRGAMGVVYKGFDTVLERYVAIKTITSGEESKESRERFIREAKSIGKLSHNNIVTIYDFGNEPSRLYIVMEYLEGSTLNRMIQEKQPIDITTKLDLVRQLCTGLAYAHSKQVIHRDIKPANLILDKNNTVKILDFGLAIMQASSLTRSGFMGTPNYIAPEIIQGDKANEKSDQFSVGLFLYEFLTYTRPFSADSIPSILFSIMNKTPNTFNCPEISAYPELEQVIQKSIHKKPEERFDSLNDLATEIENLRLRMLNDKFQFTQPIPVQEKNRERVQIPPQGQPDATPAESAKGGAEIKVQLKSSFRWFPIAMIVVILLAAILYFLLKPGNQAPAVPPQTGTLVFKSKPFSRIVEIRDLDKDKRINSKTLYSPLNIQLNPARYQVLFAHRSEKKSKTITIEAGKTVVIDHLYDRRIMAAFEKHLLIPEIPDQEQ